jgi:hypothetical protein
MHPSIRALGILFTVIGGSACNAGQPTSPGVQMLTTEATSYTAIPVGSSQVNVTVVTRFQNTTLRPILLDRCTDSAHSPKYGVSLVRPQNAEGAAYDPLWDCVAGVSPIVVGPSETRTDTLMLLGPMIFENQAKGYRGILAGTFRITYGGQSSNEFDIKLPPFAIVDP